MDIQVESLADCRIVHIKGKVTFEHCPVLQDCLNTLLDEGALRIIIDFKEVPFIDSSGIGEVIRAFKRMREKKGELILLNPNQKLCDLFAMYRFNQFMTIRNESEKQ
jgi:anti-sigma B factor antagonist